MGKKESLQLEIDNCIDQLAEDLNRFTNDITPNDYCVGYMLVKVNKCRDGMVHITRCAGGHPYVVLDECNAMVKMVSEGMKKG